MNSLSWTLQEGIDVCRSIEPIAIKLGFHVALGGSVLHKGESKKDLDIFLYRHKTQDKADAAYMRGALIAAGYNLFQKDHKAYGDDKEVFGAVVRSKNIDFFFL